MTLDAVEFLRRFVQRVLPKGSMKALDAENADDDARLVRSRQPRRSI
jgi:hypothetical protein